jgi:hypothetical protein
MANDPLADLMAQWKASSDAALKAWQEGLDKLSSSPAAEEATREFSRNFTGASARMREAREQGAEPLVEMAGGVPISEFRRLMDQIHTVLLRLDGIEDALQRIESRFAAAEAPAKTTPAAKPKRAKKKRS